MTMDRSSVEAIIERDAPCIANALMLGRWTFIWSVGQTGQHEVSSGNPSPAACIADPTYETNRVWVDPERQEDEDDLLNSIRHEALHCIESPMRLYRRAVREVLGAEHEAFAALDEIEAHVTEQIVLQLERMLDAWGLTPEVLAKLGACGAHTIKPFVAGGTKAQRHRGTKGARR